MLDFGISLSLLFEQEAMQCVEELNAHELLHVFVRVGVESTLERSQITRDHMGQLLYQLVQSGKLSKHDYFKGSVPSCRVLFSYWALKMKIVSCVIYSCAIILVH